MNKCKTCNKNCEYEYCFLHKSKKFLKKVNELKIKSKETKPKDLSEMNKFFLFLWQKRSHVSEISGEKLCKINGLPLSIYFHHILPKSKFKDLIYLEDNIIFVTFVEHQKVEQDMYFFPEINRRRQLLKIKYDL